MGTSTKLLVTKASQHADTESVLFGEVFRAARDTLASMGAYNHITPFKKKMLTSDINVSFGESDMSGSYPFTIAWTNVAGLASEEARKLAFFQKVNHHEYNFLPVVPYVYISLDAHGAANDILLMLASKLIDMGFNAFFCQNDGVSTEYIPVTQEFVQINLENEWAA